MDIKSGKASKGGMGMQDINRVMEAVNDIRSWGLASRLMHRDATPSDLSSYKNSYNRYIGSLLQVGIAIGVSRTDYIKAIQNNSSAGAKGAAAALASASKGRISENDANRLISSLFTSESNRSFLNSHGDHVMNRKECAKFINDRHLGLRGKKITENEFVPIDFVRNGKASMTIKEKQRYNKYYGL